MAANSMVETAYHYIREQIVRGDRLPGSVLSENELAAEMGMSRTPIRSAVSRLEQEGYLQALKNRGVLVKDIPFKDMLDTYEMILMLQTASIDLVTEKETAFDLAMLGERLRLQEDATAQGNYGAYVDHGLAFCKGVIGAANNVIMLRVFDSLHDKFKQAAMVNYSLTPTQPHYSMTALNRKIYEAIRTADYGEAKSALRSANQEARSRAVRGYM
ncbi:GntR family transcriptional regulator [Paenibacillus sambharensis]|uniref:GntR family transcriptional regulator n=1 Tax=Paenibacillus sambharensis TaxID=1803190 RepID=A0A2W1M067_9BACL|nr:GntR family transcriptional regulator [Paenibacillus sambharensis]PZD97127.1 GntR family transcriptional regulator [Paenibacillus sambharensis]